jgi:hypothetical protein
VTNFIITELSYVVDMLILEVWDLAFGRYGSKQYPLRIYVYTLCSEHSTVRIEFEFVVAIIRKIIAENLSNDT